MTVAHLLSRAALAACALVLGACGGCGRGGAGGAPQAASGSAEPVAARASGAADAAVPRDATTWARAKEGDVEDLATLAAVEGAAGLVEAATDPALRETAIRAMAYARGWAQLPYLSEVAAGASEDEARLALASVAELAARPRTSEDPEDADELRRGCEALGALARDVERSRERRVGAIRALRMTPCPPLELPADLDAR